ncbi:MAG: hypothetical protein WAP47_07660 [Candidatus Rokuibacteriota bacterium]
MAIEVSGYFAVRRVRELLGKRTTKEARGKNPLSVKLDAVADDHATFGVLCCDFDLDFQLLGEPQIVMIHEGNIVPGCGLEAGVASSPSARVPLPDINNG